MLSARIVKTKALDDALEREFGFGPFTWGKNLGGLSSCNIAVNTQDRSFVLKQFGAAATIQINRLEAIARFLKEKSFPAPLAEITQTGALHFFCKGYTYALFSRSRGFIRHSAELSDEALKSAAEVLAKLHLLRPRKEKNILESTPRYLYRNSSSLPSEEILRAQASQAHLTEKDIATLLKSIDTKRSLINSIDYEKCISLSHGNHFVHGDFHNENILFGIDAEVTCVLDFEESFLGQGVCDVVNFVFMALCNDGLSSTDLQAGRYFIDCYRTLISTDNQLLQTAIERYFLAMASSTFLEERLFESPKLFAALLLRDIEKMRIWQQDQRRIVRALM